MRKLFAKNAGKTKLGIALQGGGSYGAYTKGVLKALFNSKAFNNPSLEIKAVTGTSAGAVNGALLVSGLNDGGPAEALRRLDGLWSEIGEKGRMNRLWSMLDPMSPSWPNLPRSMMTAATAFLPKGYMAEQLKIQVEKQIPDWTKLQNGPVKLFVNAVRENPENGKRSHIVFKGKKLTSDAIAASGALGEFGPHIIDGVPHYDGAYWRNPCMSDIKKEDITDLLVITLQRVPEDGIRPEHQDKARAKHDKPGHELLTEEIHNHIAHIHKHHPHINLHVISLQADPKWDQSSRMNNDPRWLETLEEMGYEDGKKWLKANAALLGKKSSYATPASGDTKPPAPQPS